MSVKKIEKEKQYSFKYSICTFVTDHEEYREMVDSFHKAGFDTDCEYLYIDNSRGNTFDAYSGINRFLQEAKGEFIIICHQDILITLDDRKILEQRIQEVSTIDNNWAVLGNAGSNNLYVTSMNITEPDMKCYRSGTLPSAVKSLDENFLLIKASSNLAVSGNLSGFHLYGTDICLIAECLGYSAYAVNFNLIHKSAGKVNESFYKISKNLQLKYSRFFKGRYIKTTITRFYLSSNKAARYFLNLGMVKNIVRLKYKFRYKVLKKL